MLYADIQSSILFKILTTAGIISISLVLLVILFVILEFTSIILSDLGKLNLSLLLARPLCAFSKFAYLLCGYNYYYKGDFSIAADYFINAAQKDFFQIPSAIYYLARSNCCLEFVYDKATDLAYKSNFDLNDGEKEISRKIVQDESELNKYIIIQHMEIYQARLFMALALVFFYQAKQIDKAIELAEISIAYIEKLRHSPLKTMLYVDLAEIYLFSDQPEKAYETLMKIDDAIKFRNIFEKIIKSCNDMAAYYMVLGQVELELKLTNVAMEHFKICLKLSPESFYASVAQKYLEKFKIS